MNWLFFGFFGALFLAAIVAVLWGFVELLKEVVTFEGTYLKRRTPIRATLKGAAFVIGFFLVGGGWLVVVTILPFWGMGSVILLVATPAVGFGLLEWAFD